MKGRWTGLDYIKGNPFIHIAIFIAFRFKSSGDAIFPVACNVDYVERLSCYKALQDHAYCTEGV